MLPTTWYHLVGWMTAISCSHNVTGGCRGDQVHGAQCGGDQGGAGHENKAVGDPHVKKDRKNTIYHCLDIEDPSPLDGSHTHIHTSEQAGLFQF